MSLSSFQGIEQGRHSRKATPTPLQGPAELRDFSTDRRVLLLMAVAAVVGTFSVGAAWLLLKAIALCTNLAYFGRFSVDAVAIGASPYGYATVIVPVVGCVIIGLMARYGSEKIRGHGIPEAIEAILIGQSRINAKVAVLKPISSAISIGTGGPFGAEGPIIMTGAAIGSLLAQTIRLSSNERKALLVAGASAGMTAIFGTPLAAVLLAVELLLFEWKPRSFLPVVVAVVVAAAERTVLMDGAPLFPFHGAMALSAGAVVSWALVGLTCGLASGVLTAMVYGCEDAFQKLPLHWMWWPALGGLVVGIGGLIDPAALGVGYDNIRHALAGDLATSEMVRLLVVKSVIWAVALGSGTSGGVLAPLLIFGGAIGSIEGFWLPHADVGFWALLGMAAMMGGTMRSPLTATLFAVELTGDFSALLPLLTASGIAYATTVLLLKRSILTEKIARRGHHVTREYHVDLFELVRVADVMIREVDVLPASQSIDDTIAFFEAPEHRHKSYPVVRDDRKLVGMVSRADILSWMVERPENAATIGEAIAGTTLVVGHPDEFVGELTDRMAAAEVGRVPIIDRATRKLVGLVARKDLLKVRARQKRDEDERIQFAAFGGAEAAPALPKD
jgi:chloride channel protein, CIC family